MSGHAEATGGLRAQLSMGEPKRYNCVKGRNCPLFCWSPSLNIARTLLIPVALALPAAPAWSQIGGGDGDAGGNHIAIGLGAALLPDYEGSDNYSLAPIPGAVGQVGGVNFLVIGNQASADLIPMKGATGWDIQLGPVASVGIARNALSRVSDARIRALGKIGVAVELGGYAGLGRVGVITSDYDRLSVSVAYRHDVAGAYDGAVVTPQISYMTPLSRKAAVSLFASADHADSHYAATYFGITPAQSVASGLPGFTARSGWKSWTVGAAGGVALKGELLHGLLLVGGAGYSRLINDFGASPVTSIAGSRSQWMASLGLGYSF